MYVGQNFQITMYSAPEYCFCFSKQCRSNEMPRSVTVHFGLCYMQNYLLRVKLWQCIMQLLVMSSTVSSLVVFWYSI